MQRLREPIHFVGDIKAHEARMIGDARGERGEQPPLRRDQTAIGNEVVDVAVGVIDQERRHEEKAAELAVEHGDLDVETVAIRLIEQQHEALDVLRARRVGVELELGPDELDADMVHLERRDVGEIALHAGEIPITPEIPPRHRRHVVDAETHPPIARGRTVGRCGHRTGTDEPRAGRREPKADAGSGAPQERPPRKSASRDQYVPVDVGDRLTSDCPPLPVSVGDCVVLPGGSASNCL